MISTDLVLSTTYLTLTSRRAVSLHVSTYDVHVLRHESTVAAHVLRMIFLYSIIGSERSKTSAAKLIK